MSTLNRKQGFTLIELLVVVSIIGVLLGISLFGLQGARESSRDAKRKADLELIRSGVEIYRADCNKYPTASELAFSLVGDDSTPSCSSGNTYIKSVPTDPADPSRSYRYSSNTVTYGVCSSLELGSGTVTCGGSSDCGSTCNYKVANP